MPTPIGALCGAFFFLLLARRGVYDLDPRAWLHSRALLHQYRRRAAKMRFIMGSRTSLLRGKGFCAFRLLLKDVVVFLWMRSKACLLVSKLGETMTMMMLLLTGLSEFPCLQSDALFVSFWSAAHLSRWLL